MEFYIKALSNQVLYLQKEENRVRGFWTEGTKLEPVNIKPLSIESYSSILEHLNDKEKLVLGYSLEEQHYYGMFVSFKEGKRSIDVYVTSMDIFHVLSSLNKVLMNEEEIKKNRGR